MTPEDIAQEVNNYFFQIHGFYPENESMYYISDANAIIEMTNLVKENLQISVVPDPSETLVEYIVRVQTVFASAK